MGRAEYHAADHKPTQLQALIDAMNLHAHTCIIMSNPKVFEPCRDFRDMTMVHIFETTLEILRRVAEANAIDFRESERNAQERLFQQSVALATIDWLLILEAQARKQFTALARRGKKDHFWHKKTVELKDRVKAWHEGDRKRVAALYAAAPKEDFSSAKSGDGNGCRLNRSLGGQLPLAVG